MTINLKMADIGCVKLLALSKSRDGYKAHSLIEFLNIDGECKRILLPSSMIMNKAKLRDYLVDAGHPTVGDSTYWTHVVNKLSGKVDARFDFISRPGWHGYSYILPNGKVLMKEGKYPAQIYPETAKKMTPESKRGSREQWLTEVAPYALYSSRIMLALCTAFAGPLVRIVGIESGGFHFYGDSSKGKTTCLLVAASVFGDSNFKESWDNTEKALEEIAESHNDSLLVLDELKLLDEDPKVAAYKASRRAYVLAEGVGKTRSVSYQRDGSAWALSILSAGEESLNQHVARSGSERMEGEQVRLIDVPADAGCDLGIFETLPDGCTAGSQLSDNLKDACENFYGTIKFFYLRRLARMLKRERRGLIKSIKRDIEYFFSSHNVDRNSGQPHRIAKRFALSYAAGVIASDVGALPYTKAQIFEGISRCYQAAVREETERVLRPLNEFQQWLDDVDVKDIRAVQKELSRDEVQDFPVVMGEIGGKDVLAVQKKSFDVYFDQLQRELAEQVTQMLVEKDVLYKDASGKMTRPLSLGGDKSDRRYCFLIKGLRDSFGFSG